LRRAARSSPAAAHPYPLGGGTPGMTASDLSDRELLTGTGYEHLPAVLAGR
jgi:hypothetical protein